jgi:hypothetical protein
MTIFLLVLSQSNPTWTCLRVHSCVSCPPKASHCSLFPPTASMHLTSFFAFSATTYHFLFAEPTGRALASIDTSSVRSPRLHGWWLRSRPPATSYPLSCRSRHPKQIPLDPSACRLAKPSLHVAVALPGRPCLHFSGPCSAANRWAASLLG